MQAPVIVVNTNTQRESGRKAQLSNIMAAKTVADVIRSCLGPSSMLKMLMDPMGGIVLTNDGNAILREIEVAHPAAKSMIELARTQDEEVGDGTTSVIILAGELLSICQSFLERDIHPIIIISGLRKALTDSITLMKTISIPIDINDDVAMRNLIQSSINTKFSVRYTDLMVSLALKAVRIVATADTSATDGRREVDIKRYVRIEKIPGGEVESSTALDGIILNKDVTHPSMRRRIENPRILLLDCPLEYKKGESQTNLELLKDTDWQRVLEVEEEQVKEMCDKIIALKPDLVFTEKGISDLAQHYFVKANITAIRRVRKMDNFRIARATGASVVNRTEDLKESDIGTGCGMFHIEKIADEYFTYLDQCKNPKACSIILRGASKDVLNELERNLLDAMCVARNVYYTPRLVPGGGAIEMALSVNLSHRARSLVGVEGSQVAGPYRAVAEALDVIPRTLISNCGGDVIRTLTDLRAKHASLMLETPSTNSGHSPAAWGIDGLTGKIVDMNIAASSSAAVWEPMAVKMQTLQTAVESACMLLRVDDIVSGISKKGRESTPAAPSMETGGNEGAIPEND